MRSLSKLAIVAALILAAGPAPAATLTISKLDEAPPPDALSPAIRPLLAPGAARVESGKTVLEFWWMKAIEAAAADWAKVPEGALVGAVRISESYPDIRGRRMKAGVYTLRFALQPMNGDHLGVSPNREFLLASPASADTAPGPAGHDATVGLSKQATGASHPAVWAMDPPPGGAEVLASYTNDLDHEGVVFQVQTPSGPLKFGLVLVGKIEA